MIPGMDFGGFSGGAGGMKFDLGAGPATSGPIGDTQVNVGPYPFGGMRLDTTTIIIIAVAVLLAIKFIRG